MQVAIMQFLQPSLPPCYARISSSAPYSETPSAYVVPSTFKTKFHTRMEKQANL